MSTGGISSLLDVSRRALSAQTQAIRVIGDNVANVNTEGYSRRRAELVTKGSSNVGANAVGSGVDVDKIVRITDEFINAELIDRIEDRASADIRQEFLSRAESPFSLEGSEGHIGARLTAFFSALEDLATNPASIPLRTQVLEEGDRLAQSINSAYNVLSGLQREADQRIEILVSDVNRLSGEIANLNFQLSKSEIGDQENLTLRDQRDQLIRDLAELVEIETVENSDGSLLVSLENGFALVKGSDNQELEFTRSPSFDGGLPDLSFPPGLDGQALGFIVYDFDSTAASAHVDLTSVIRNGGGEIGGLLSLRGTQSTSDTDTFHTDGDLVDLAARVELIARDLLTSFNQAYMGGDENGGMPGTQARSGDLDGNSPNFDGLFTFNGADDADLDGLFEQSDLDDYTQNNGYFAGFASVLEFNITDPRAFAAALDLDGAAGSTSFAPGDSRNIDNLLNLRSQERTMSIPTDAPVKYTTTTTLENLYDVTVSHAGSLANRAESDYEIYSDRELQVKELQSSASGVSLDEEFAKLINFQRAFEGAARMIRIGDELLAQIMQML